MNNQKKALLLLWTYIIIFFTPKIKSNKKTIQIIYNDNYIYEQTPYATYDDKLIYICSVDYINNNDISNNENIYIIDDRKSKDADMSIYNSYQINNLKEINELINLLIEYENNNPSDWNRSFKSMKNEWIIHNICYYLTLEKDRTRQVDFNNNDEETYLNYLNIIKEIIASNKNSKYFDTLIDTEINKESKIKKLIK